MGCDDLITDNSWLLSIAVTLLTALASGMNGIRSGN